MIEFTPPDKDYKAYIFDCDGTLADSMPTHLEAWNAGLAAAKAPFQLEGKAFMSVAGMSIQETVEHWNKVHAVKIDPDVIVSVKSRYFAEHQHRLRSIPAVERFAREMASKGKAVAVASGGSREDVEKTLQIIGLSDLFPVVVTADDVANSKPAPDLFLLAAERLGVDPGQCLVIEDSLLGVEAAEKAGMDSALVPHRLG